jgi:hypothetical protein
MVVAIWIEFTEFQVSTHTQPFEQLPGSPPLLHLADVVYSGAELVTLQREGMGPPSGEVMLLKNQDTLADI